MGQAQVNPFNQTLKDYELIQTREIDRYDFVTHLSNPNSQKQYVLRQLKFTDQDSYTKSLEKHQIRHQFSCKSLQKLVEIKTNKQEKMCSDLFEIYSLWNTQSHNLEKQINNRSAINRKFESKQLMLLIKNVIDAMAQLEKKQILHQRIKSSSIIVNDVGEIIMSDPLALAEMDNFDKVSSRKFSAEETQGIYLSPEQCLALQNEARCFKSAKNDVWAFGMVVLECAELGNQSICYRHQKTKINWAILERRIEKLQKEYTPQISQIVKSMLNKKKSKRPSWLDLSQQLTMQKNIPNKRIEGSQQKNKIKTNFIQLPLIQTNGLNQYISPPQTARFGNQNSAKGFPKNISDIQANLPINRTPIANPPFVNIPASTSIYRSNSNCKFTYNPTVIPQQQPQFNYAQQQPQFNYAQKNTQSIYHNVLPKTQFIIEPKKLNPPIQHPIWPAYETKNSYSSAGFYLRNSQQNNMNFNNIGIYDHSIKNTDYLSKKPFEIKSYETKNQFISPSVEQGYLFSHKNYAGIEKDSSDQFSSNKNPYISSDIMMSWEKQKNSQHNRTFGDHNSTHKQDKVDNNNNINNHNININNEPKREFIKEAESITYQGTAGLQFLSRQKQILGEKFQNEVLNSDNYLQQKQDDEDVEEKQELEYVIENFKEGSKYQGYKMGNMRHGKGKFYYQDGGFYDGQWFQNHMQGFGKLYYQSGNLAYEGYWVEDRFQGRGKLYNDSPDQIIQESYNYRDFDPVDDYWTFYEGQFQDDLKKGRGKLMLINGQYFIGDFYDDMIHGKGTFVSKHGTIKGIWEQNHLIEQY